MLGCCVVAVPGCCTNVLLHYYCVAVLLRCGPLFLNRCDNVVVCSCVVMLLCCWIVVMCCCDVSVLWYYVAA